MNTTKINQIGNENKRFGFLTNKISKPWVFANAFVAIIYFLFILLKFPQGNPVLYFLLILGEVFHVWQVIGYTYTIWNTEYRHPFDKTFCPEVDVFITVCGEPVEIVEKTAIAALNMRYPKFNVYILNDGYVAKKENWQEMEILSEKLGINCITRKIPGGAKAGNINNGLKIAKSDFFAVFDADHEPHKDFLSLTIGYFKDEKMGFVQTPQFYHNSHINYVTGGAWEQQSLFFGPIMKGKNRDNSAFMCGTNMVIRKEAILQAGGMCETNIAEDFLTSLFIHAKGWKSSYVPKVLAEGLSPEDFLSYYKQQFRWTRGSLEVIFKHNPIFMKGLKWRQKFQYLSSASYYLSGIVILIDAVLPLFYFYFGLVPVQTSTMSLAAVFIPYIFVNLYVLQASVNFSYTFRAISFSMSSFYIQIKALIAVLTGQKTSFSVTSKNKVEGNFLYLVIPQITYISLVIFGIIFAVVREGFTASIMTNASWGILNSATFIPFIIAASPPFKIKSLFKSKNKKYQKEFTI